MTIINPDADALSDSVQLRARLVALTGGADTLLAAVRTGTVRRAICDLAQQVSDADAMAIWKLNAALGEWRIVHSVGLSDAFTARCSRARPSPLPRLSSPTISTSHPSSNTAVPNTAARAFAAS